MLLFLVPIFEKMYTQLGGQLPTLTQAIITASNLLQSDWYIIFPAIGAGALRLLPLEEARRWAASAGTRFKLKIPMKIGDIVLKVTMARFARTLATLVAAGIDIIKALEITGTTAGNWVVENALHEVREKVHRGVPIAQPLVEHPVFPPMVSQMVKIGEETGELDAMLGKIADFYEEEVDASITALTSIIEPIMMIGVGIMVGDDHPVDVPADVQAADAGQVAARALAQVLSRFNDSAAWVASCRRPPPKGTEASPPSRATWTHPPASIRVGPRAKSAGVKLGALVWPQYTDWQSLRETGALVDRLGLRLALDVGPPVPDRRRSRRGRSSRGT